MMSCITPTKRLDMWFKDRSVNTTEYSSSPSGSTSGRGRLTPADCHRSTRRAALDHPVAGPRPDRSADERGQVVAADLRGPPISRRQVRGRAGDLQRRPDAVVLQPVDHG